MLPEEVKPDNLDHQNLIAITRLLQKLSNNVIADPGTASEWMDPFVERNNGRMREYLLLLCQDPGNHRENFSHVTSFAPTIFSSALKTSP
jgi:hypothetical protein